ncbi:Ankyrin-3 [Chionoecetes opilio]|uniref:Ankyrin-3 n=1 Tax=Chionoecetes opilio TaxID=41210 RepID=A0A8J4YST2_CHIOP|nr:Ankyrin-3 [Chionoecetes opilio]
MRRVFNLFHKKKHSLVRDLTFKSSSNDGHDNAAVVTLSDEDTGDATTNTCDIHTDQRISALFNAIQRHDVEDVKALVQDSAIGLLETPCGGLTPLLVACHTRHLPILKLLLQHHARTEAEDHQGSTALHTAICDGWIEGVTELLKHGASPCLQDASAPASALCVAETPLRAAVRTGNVTVLQLILKHHPNTSVMDSEEGSLLHLAARSHQPHMVKFLLMEHKSLEILRSCGQNGDSVMHAVLQKSSKAKDENPFLETLRMFFEAGVDVNVKNNHGETPLFLAARRRLPKCTELLISFGADLFAMTQWGQSVLHGACLGGCALCLNILLKASRLDHLVTLPDLEGVQPFHCAVRSSSIDCCELLLTNGDHLTHTDAEGTSRCSLLLQHFPSTSSSQLLTRIFNSHISLSDDPPYDRNSHVIFDYSQILSSSNTTFRVPLLRILITIKGVFSNIHW